MKNPRYQNRLSPFQYVYALSLWVLALFLCLTVLGVTASAQEEGQEPAPPETLSTLALPDAHLPQIAAAIQGVTTPDVSALAKALHIGGRVEGTAPGAPINTLAAVGDLDGDGVPELLFKWAIPEAVVEAGAAPVPDSQPFWGVYLLSWDGAHWKASHLVTGVEDFVPILINLGPPLGRCMAVVIQEGDAQVAYPAVFQFKDHAATLLWDAQADNSRYEPLLQGQVSFQDRAGASAEMIVTGRADPGLLQVDPRGQRGFRERAVYHWDGKAFIPAKPEYSTNQDYTIYRFISALHLHDYRSAYALIVPTKFLNADSPTLDMFRQFIQDHWPEFLQDEVFQAPEGPEGAPDKHVFALHKPDKRYVYHPVFSGDGKFLLTGLTRTQEAAEPEIG
jgi:hypothetical protein